jgi:hypothetical protein
MNRRLSAAGFVICVVSLEGDTSGELQAACTVSRSNREGLPETWIRRGCIHISAPNLGRQILHLVYRTLLIVRVIGDVESFRLKLQAYMFCDADHACQAQVNVIHARTAE